MNIEHTAHKLRSLGARIRLKGSDHDKRRILQRHCDRMGLSPVYDCDHY